METTQKTNHRGFQQLLESLQRKRATGEWIETLIVKQSNAVYCAP
jgi:hypothetical protein